jgi:hypothetical protein
MQRVYKRSEIYERYHGYIVRNGNGDHSPRFDLNMEASNHIQSLIALPRQVEYFGSLL